MKRIAPLAVQVADVAVGGAVLEFLILAQEDLTPSVTLASIETVATFVVSQN